MKRIVIFAACALLIAGCAPSAPSAEAIQTAIAQTQAAQPSATPTLVPVPTSTATSAPAPTIAPTSPPQKAAPVPPPDSQVIDTNPKSLVLDQTDFPAEGGYYVPHGVAMGAVTNAEVTPAPTAAAGKKPLEVGGRIYGWKTEFWRGLSKAAAPDIVRNEVALYSTAEAAKSAVEAEMDCAGYPGMEPASNKFTIGDAMAACVSNVNGSTDYRLAFSYKNVVSVIEARGSEADVNSGFLQAIAEKQLERLQAQTLSETVKFTP